jgi:hypothetical protein
MSKIDLSVEVRDDLIVVMQHSPEFFAVYAMAPDEPQLKLQSRSKTDDQTLLAQAWQSANQKARELGWIV